MKRRLVHGNPIGNNRPTVPAPLHICQCYDCSNGTCSDPTNGLPRTGRLVTTIELRQHEELARSRGVAPRHIADAFTMRSLLPEANPQTPSSTPNMDSFSVRPQSQRQYTKSLIDNLSTAFHNLDTITKHQPKFCAYNDIVFCVPPSAQTQPLAECNPHKFGQIFDLKPGIPANNQLMAYKRDLSNALAFVEKSQTKYGTLPTRLRLKGVTLRKFFEQELLCVERSLQCEWERQRWISMETSTNYVNMTPYMNRSSMVLKPYFLAAYLLVLILHLLCGLSMEHCKFVLGVLNIMSNLPTSAAIDLADSNPQKTPGTHESHSGVTDIRTVEKIMLLDCSSNSYVSCPKCSYLYAYKRDGASLKDSVPEKCTNRLHPDSEPCSRRLWRSKHIGGAMHHLPTREFLHQSMKSWVGWMYSRADIEKLLDEDPTSPTHQTEQSDLLDIWDASGLREFKGPDGETPFYVRPGNEGRLIFSLNMDGFNPYTNKEAGKKVSTGAIYMVCLNLPPSLRYKEENIYLVGIIPGPHEPSLHEINYLLEPLVDDLLEFWNPGVFYSHTPSNPHGRWVRCAVVPLVCDLPAARQMSGSAHYTSACFCSYCWLQLEHIDDLNYSTWRPRTMGSHRKAAELWLNAPTAADRDAVYHKYGTRWSDLLRLPYWDPVRFTVIDPMHAFYLRIISHHCREIWGMDSALPDADSRRKDTDPTDKEMKEANIVLRNGTLTELKSLKVNVLRQLCIETTILKPRGRKEHLYSRLVEYRQRNGWPRVETPEEKEASLDADARYLFNHGSKSTLKQTTKDMLLRILCVNVNPQKDYSQETNAKLRATIQQARYQAGIIDENEALLLEKPKKHKVTAVLGKETLAEVWADMARTSLPSSFSKAPNQPGDKQWGKITAHGWRSFGLVNLPITLIRLWGKEPKSSRKRQMLDNYMHLVTAIKIATMRSIRTDQVAEYRKHMHAYLESLSTLYPNTALTPYQHLALHFGDLLERFGPTQAWHCFPFERYNHRMQQISTNNKFGEMEKTMFRRFRLSQLVRSFFHLPTLPTCLHQMVDLYEKTFSKGKGPSISTIKNHIIPHDLSFNTKDRVITYDGEFRTRLSLRTVVLLKKWLRSQNYPNEGEVDPHAFLHQSVYRLGQRFSTSQKSFNDSYVLFRSVVEGNSEHFLCAGRVEELFSHTCNLANGQIKTGTFAVVVPFKKLSATERQADCYRDFPVVANQVFKIVTEEPILLPIELVVSHFAHVSVTLDIQGAAEECVVAYPLDYDGTH